MASPSSTPTQTTNWSKCALCQEDGREKLTSPTAASYKTIAQNISQFTELNCMPVQIDISRLNSGNGVEATFKEQNAKWHKSCSLKFSTSKLDRAKKRKQKSDVFDDGATTSKRVFTRSSIGEADTHMRVDSTSPVCFFCSKPETKTDKLHDVSTFQVDFRVRKCALKLQDENLLAKLAAGPDLIALEAKYHAGCLATLYNKTVRIPHDPETSSEQMCKGVALAELISYIEEKRQGEDVKVFKLADLTKLYAKRLEQLGVTVSSRVNSTHLKDRIVIHLPGMKAFKEGRDVFMAYEDDIGAVLRQGYQTDRDEQSVMMTQIANTIRYDIFAQTIRFSGSFDQTSQVESVPQSLLSLVSMLVNGSNIKDQTSNRCLSQPVLTIAQLLMSNCIKRRRNECGKVPHVYHSKDRETPLPVYLGLKAHALTREKKLVDSLYALGISVSYDRIMDIITSLGNNVCDYYHQIGTVCPPQIWKRQFITAAADNIDHNPSSATSTDSFHGTSISLFQSVTTEDTISDDNGSGFSHHITPQKGQRKVKDLPISYSEIKPTGLPSSDVYVPLTAGNMNSSCNNLSKEMEKEYDWLRHVENLYEDEISSESNISWAAYHASFLPEPDILPSINAMLPLFAEEASSPPMLGHCFEVIHAVVQYANPGQTPVITVDQPLFAKMKQLQ